MVSSEIDEVLGECHRAYVMHKGKLVAELSHNELTRENILAASFIEA